MAAPFSRNFLNSLDLMILPGTIRRAAGDSESGRRVGVMNTHIRTVIGVWASGRLGVWPAI